MPPNYQAPVAVLGLKETLRALDTYDARTRRAIRRELSQAAYEVASLAKTYVDPEGLSGWGKWKGGYDPARIEAGIRLTSAASRKNAAVQRDYLAVVNSTPAGAIWELAGRKSDGKPPREGRRRQRVREGRRYRYTGVLLGNYGNGRAFVDAIRKRGGQASRTVWAAYDQTNAGFIRNRIEQMLIREGRTTQADIDRNPF